MPMSLGTDYRKILDKKRAREDKKQARIASAETKRLSGWFNRIAKSLPALMDETLKAAECGANGPSLRWDYTGDHYDFRSYSGEKYNKTKGFETFARACQKLDVDFECEVKDTRNMIDDRIHELQVRIRPDKPFDEEKAPWYVALGL